MCEMFGSLHASATQVGALESQSHLLCVFLQDLTRRKCPGFTKEQEENSCVGCAAGKYKDQPGDDTCTDCPSGKYSDLQAQDSSSSCIHCPADAISPAGSDALGACVCNAGYTGPDGGECLACVEGTVKAAVGSAGCDNCLEGTYIDTVAATACESCPSDTSTLAEASTGLTLSLIHI